ncbi:Rv3235 family protein [Lapillicoccus sp.]|uniref:Rv3235 family protein n=1 Tax=Lapillicoccus sp. TaxID=1909287 RepID=UPI0025F1795D|nr:Rv3235 family protein [Lapillicoccus sp.]
MTRTRLRVLPIPSSEPPVIDADEAHRRWPAPSADYVQDALAVDFGHDDDETWFDRRPTRTLDLPDPELFTARISQAIVEVLAGTRPAPQVVRWTSADVYAVLARRSLVAARRGVAAGRSPVVRRVRVCQPADGVIEASAVVFHPDRVRAMALRLIGLDGRWVVTALQVG